MSWWRKKADDDLGEDNILDLDNVVWRGINQEDRLNRLAEAARQADGELPAPGEKIYPPQKPVLPTVPLPISNVDEDEDEDIARPDDVIETEIRQQVIAEAMESVLAFQEGRPQNNDQSSREQKPDFDPAEIEATIEEIADQTIAEVQSSGQLDQVANTAPTKMDAEGLGPAPDMSDAIRNVVADEIGSWLKDHMPRIMAETIAQSNTDLAAKSAPKTSTKIAAKKTKPKVKAKTPKTMVKGAGKASKKKASKKASKSRK